MGEAASSVAELASTLEEIVEKLPQTRAPNSFCR
jgi:hypothetical protein